MKYLFTILALLMLVGCSDNEDNTFADKIRVKDSIGRVVAIPHTFIVKVTYTNGDNDTVIMKFKPNMSINYGVGSLCIGDGDNDWLTGVRKVKILK